MLRRYLTALHGAAGDRHGAAMVEYALLAALIAVVALGAASALGANVSSEFSALASSI